MSRDEQKQPKIGSAFARKRARETAKQTGMTATEVIEDAFRGYVPAVAAAPVGRLVRRGAVPVRPADGRTITLREADAALEVVRERDVGSRHG